MQLHYADMPKPKREIPVLAAKRDVRVRIKEIKAFVAARDFEAAHAREDDLMRDVLQALSTQKLDFPRDCA